jgi:hypothetical protein
MTVLAVSIAIKIASKDTIKYLYGLELRSPYMDAWRGVAMDYLIFHPGLLSFTLLFPAGRPPLKRPYDLQLSSTPWYTPRHTPMALRTVARNVFIWRQNQIILT